MSLAQYSYLNQLFDSIGDQSSESSSNVEVVGDEYVLWGVRNNGSSVDYYTRRLDLNGQITQENSFTFSNVIYAGITFSFEYDAESDEFYLAQGLLNEEEEIEGFHIRFNSELDTIFSRRYDLYPSHTYLWSPEKVSDGLIILGRRGVPQISNGTGTFLLKVDGLGNIIWNQPLDDAEPGLHHRNNSLFEEDNKLIILGGKYHPGGAIGVDEFTGLITVTDILGNVISQTEIDDSEAEKLAYLFGVRLMDGNILMVQDVGYEQFSEFTDPNFMWVKIRLFILDPISEEIIWQQDYHEDYSLLGYGASDLIPTPDGGALILGTNEDPELGNFSRSFMMKIAPDGTEEWFKEYTYLNCETCINYLLDIELAEDGGYVAVGEFRNVDINPVETGVWVLKVDACGDVEWQGCEPLNTSQIDKTEFNIYPNPTAGDFTINSLEGERISEYKVGDLSGRTILDQKLRAPQQTLSDHLDVPAGVYIVEIISEMGKISRQKIQVFRK